MKLNINSLKITPKHVAASLQLCVYGLPNEEVKTWIDHWKLSTIFSAGFTNIELTVDHPLEAMFQDTKHFTYVDGFSPNLNKNLHIGHLSNLVLAKAFQGMKIGQKYIAIFGDTVTGEVKKEDALEAYENYCRVFNYKVHKSFMASQMKIRDFSKIENGQGEYTGTKVLNIDEEKVVLIKSDGSTTYFYQDVALIQELNEPTLYLTGFEQDNHFKILNKLSSNVSHIGLGLLLIDGKKMSSSEGNVIFVSDFLNMLLPLFDNNLNLVYNVIAGMILKSEPESVKNINTKIVNNVKVSLGLYVSYIMARMNSAGIDLIASSDYTSVDLKFKSLKAKINLKPNILFDGLVDHCHKISVLYKTHQISGNDENKKMFQTLTGDLMLAANELGLLKVERV